MLRNRFGKIFLCFLAAAVLTGALCVPARAVSQSQIDELKAERARLQARAEEQQTEIDRLSEAQALYVVRKMALDQRIETNRQEIEVINRQIELYNQMLREKEEELNAAVEAEENQARQLRSCMRAMEEGGSMSYLNVLLESDSLTDLLSRTADITDITRHDRELEANFRNARSYKESLRSDYRELLSEQETMQEELAEKQAYLDSQVEAACSLLANIDTEAANAQAEYDAMNLALDEADAEIEALVKKLEEQRAAEAAEAARRAAAAAAARNAQTISAGQQDQGAAVTTTAVGSENLSWPVPSSNLVTSSFGGRVAPTAGASSNHQGMDIGASAGSSIVAAGGGTVVAATSNSGYGNYVVIDHGDGTTTLYAHMQSSAVSVGQHVTQDQVIGYVGSTGVATGPHLHYEVRVGGSQTDPSVYYSGLNYY